MSIRTSILLILADGKFHSGTELGVLLGVSRMAINKGIKGLQGLGISIHSIHGKGYRLLPSIEVLQTNQIEQQLSSAQKAGLINIEILEKVDSTNEHLKKRLDRSPTSSGIATICLAEYQTQGKGRRGRSWIASAYRDLMFSLAWSFDSGPASISGLSLAAAVAVVQALERYGVSGCGIKWPNDIFWRDKKLGGLLVDVHGEISGPCQTVIGLGLNIDLQDLQGECIDQPWVSLNQIFGQPVERNKLAGQIIASMLEMLKKFQVSGLVPFRDEWERLNIYSGRRVEVRGNSYNGFGTVQGIDGSGALLIKSEQGEIRRCLSGEVRLSKP